NKQRNRAEQKEKANYHLLYAAHMNLAEQAWEAESITRMMELLRAYLPVPGREDLRGFEWYLLWERGCNTLLVLQHKGEVSSVEFSPDGKKLATGSFDRMVKLWNVDTGRELAALKGDEDAIRSVAFSPDGKRMATGSNDRTVK